jgi:hypothetical protein
MGFVHNKEDADDLTQETFIRAYQSLPEFKMKSAFSTWLYRIAVNTSLNKVRKSSGTSFCRGLNLSLAQEIKWPGSLLPRILTIRKYFNKTGTFPMDSEALDSLLKTSGLLLYSANMMIFHKRRCRNNEHNRRRCGSSLAACKKNLREKLSGSVQKKIRK